MGSPSTMRVHVGLLLGRRVRDAAGAPVGRIEEIRAEQRDGRCIVREYVTGRRGAVARFSMADMGHWLLRLLGMRSAMSGFTVPAELMDLSDPERPRLRCVAGELAGRG
jgi:hypothetical protein